MRFNWLALLTILWLLALAILFTLYGAWLFYPIEAESLSLGAVVGLDQTTLLKNFNILMVYLMSPFSWMLNMPDFPASASGLKHFADVKFLFHLVQVIFLGLSYPVIRFIRKAIKAHSLRLYRPYFLMAALAPVVIAGLGALIGFDEFFTLFHQVLFPGDSSWLFNPATDPIIWVLPEPFFLHCFIAFFAIYECLMVGMMILSKKSKK